MSGNPVQTYVEKRRSPRTPVQVRVEYATVDALFSEFSRNVNEGGIFIVTEQPLALEERVQLSFCLPGSDQPVKVSGRVAWVSPPDSDCPGMGIEFETLDPAARRQIDEIVRQLRV